MGNPAEMSGLSKKVMLRVVCVISHLLSASLTDPTSHRRNYFLSFYSPLVARYEGRGHDQHSYVCIKVRTILLSLLLLTYTPSLAWVTEQSGRESIRI